MNVAVIVPVRNRPGLVIEALETVAVQTLPPTRVVVVDDGSTDDTPDSVEAYLDRRGRPAGWGLLRRAWAGAAPARQHGYESCRPVDAVAFLDSDDLWPGDFLERAVRALGDDPGLVGVSADRRHHDMARERVRYDDLSLLARQPLPWMIRNDAGFGSCSLIRASALEAIGGYPVEEETGHDIVLFAELFLRGRWGHLPGEPVTFRRHHAAQTGQADHIAATLRDANLRHARLYDAAAAGLAREHARSLDIRVTMARRWTSAAKTCLKLNDSTQGLQCLTRAKQYQPISVRGTRLKFQLLMSRRAAARA